MTSADITLEVSVKDFPQLKGVMDAVANKIATWDRLCKCVDEFGQDNSPEYCYEYIQADDDAMIALKAAAGKLVAETG